MNTENNSTYYEAYDAALEAYSNYKDLQFLEEEGDDYIESLYIAYVQAKEILSIQEEQKQ